MYVIGLLWIELRKLKEQFLLHNYQNSDIILCNGLTLAKSFPYYMPRLICPKNPMSLYPTEDIYYHKRMYIR